MSRLFGTYYLDKARDDSTVLHYKRSPTWRSLVLFTGELTMAAECLSVALTAVGACILEIHSLCFPPIVFAVLTHVISLQACKSLSTR